MDCRGRPLDSLAMTHYLSHFVSVIARSGATKQSSLQVRVFRARLPTCKVLKWLVYCIVPDFVLQDDSLTLVLFSIHFSFFYNGVFFTSKQGTLAQFFHVPCFSFSLYSFQPFFYSYLVGLFPYFNWVLIKISNDTQRKAISEAADRLSEQE